MWNASAGGRTGQIRPRTDSKSAGTATTSLRIPSLPSCAAPTGCSCSLSSTWRTRSASGAGTRGCTATTCAITGAVVCRMRSPRRCAAGQQLEGTQHAAAGHVPPLGHVLVDRFVGAEIAHVVRDSEAPEIGARQQRGAEGARRGKGEGLAAQFRQRLRAVLAHHDDSPERLLVAHERAVAAGFLRLLEQQRVQIDEIVFAGEHALLEPGDARGGGEAQRDAGLARDFVEQRLPASRRHDRGQLRHHAEAAFGNCSRRCSRRLFPTPLYLLRP